MVYAKKKNSLVDTRNSLESKIVDWMMNSANIY
jgi:hypothetical protein